MNDNLSLSKPVIVPPTCEDCGKQMRLVSIEPHDRYTDLDSRNFICFCGAATSDTVVREPKPRP
jgi:hypothetical protein